MCIVNNGLGDFLIVTKNRPTIYKNVKQSPGYREHKYQIMDRTDPTEVCTAYEKLCCQD